MFSRSKFLSVGFSYLAGEIVYRNLFKEYSNYIHDVYFNLPYSSEYSTRTVERKYQERAGCVEEILIRVLACAKQHEIKVNLVVNTHNDPPLLEKHAETLARKIDIDILTTTPRHLWRLGCFTPQDVVYSFNAGIRSLDDVNSIFSGSVWTHAVIGGPFLRCIDLVANLTKVNVSSILLLNNGCSYNCYTYCNPSSGCGRLFNRNMAAQRDVNYLYALQSVTPDEMPAYFDSGVRLFKISTRPSDGNYLRRVMNSYSNFSEFDWNAVDFASDRRLWCRLAHFEDYGSSLDVGAVKKYKDGLKIDTPHRLSNPSTIQV